MRLLPLTCLSAAAAAFCVCACGGNDDNNSSPTITADACAALAGKAIGGATISAGVMVPAAAASGPNPSVPAYCKVSAAMAPSLNFEVRLPASWNGKFHYSGGGGFDGTIPTADLNSLSLGYVDASSDSGHQGNALDGSFATDPVKLDLFAQLSVPTVAAAAKLIVQTAYGTPASRSYYEGCSNGGREGLMTALRFPTMFDGVIAKAPAKFIAPIESYKRTATLLAIPGSALNAAKLSLIDSTETAACDSLDGAADGLISNVAACHFDVSVLRCASGTDEGNTCLSDAQIAVVKTLSSAMVGGTGTAYVTSFPPYMLWGDISLPGAWGSWLVGNPKTTIVGLFAVSVVQSLLGGSPNANWYDYDFVANAPIVKARADLIDVTDPNMVPFKSTGAKVLLWNGASDPAVPAQGTIDYYNQVVAAVGGQAAADGFARMYLAPGVLHCGGGAGADRTDAMLPALDAWITNGTAPGSLSASRLDANGVTVLSRPLCPYPTYARYTGTGDMNNGANFTCTAP
jgi:feruloyl esterase